MCIGSLLGGDVEAILPVVPVYSVRLGNIELAPIPGQHGPACF